MKQKDSVYSAVSEAIDFEDGDDVNSAITTDQRKEVHAMVFDGLKSGEVDFSDQAKTKYSDDKLLNGYVSGLISNWLRKDPRMNGNTKYVAKNPGSRTGQGDPQIRELRKLLKIHQGTEKAEEIQGFIDSRVTELKAAKAKDIKVDFEHIPEELQNLVS